MSKITNLDGCRLRRIMHLDGSDRDGRWFAEVQQVVEHPRITRMIKQWRKRTKSVETTWSLDGESVGTLENTLAAYNALPLPPVTTTDRVMLQQLTDGWQKTPFPAFSLTGLRDKGLVEFNLEVRGEVRRTSLALQVIGAQ